MAGAMAYSVKQMAEMSGVSVRTLHFYDETGLLRPAFCGANGYRFYEEPQVLTLQQILFYRELGFELKQIRQILEQPGFDLIAALKSHRVVLEQNVARTRTLIETIDRTLLHLKGTMKMKTEDMFAGFSVAAGKDRFDDRINLGAAPVDCKVSGKDTDGRMCIFEFTGGGGPKHLHLEQDEWIYVLEGEIHFQVAGDRMLLGPGGSVFIPRGTPHAWSPVIDRPGRVINVYQPAGTMEELWRELAALEGKPTREQVLANSYSDEQKKSIGELYAAHGMLLLGPPQVVQE
jgi:DNA-binding transcriptional MerR regulator/quercetin dioxygenase-like cupin family protein